MISMKALAARDFEDLLQVRYSLFVIIEEFRLTTGSAHCLYLRVCFQTTRTMMFWIFCLTLPFGTPTPSFDCTLTPLLLILKE